MASTTQTSRSTGLTADQIKTSAYIANKMRGILWFFIRGYCNSFIHIIHCVNLGSKRLLPNRVVYIWPLCVPLHLYFCSLCIYPSVYGYSTLEQKGQKGMFPALHKIDPVFERVAS